MASNFEVSQLIDCYGSLLSEKQYNIIYCYYNEDLSLSEIAENEGITRQGVSDSVKRSERFLREAEEKLKIIKNTASLRAFAETVSENETKSRLLALIDELY